MIFALHLAPTIPILLVIISKYLQRAQFDKKKIIYVGNVYCLKGEYYFNHCFDAVKQNGVYSKFPFHKYITRYMFVNSLENQTPALLV